MVFSFFEFVLTVVDDNNLGHNGLYSLPSGKIYQNQLICLLSSLVRTANNASDTFCQSLWNRPLHVSHSVASDSSLTSLLQSLDSFDLMRKPY